MPRLTSTQIFGLALALVLVTVLVLLAAVSYQPEAESMHVLRILLLAMTAGALAFIL